MSEQADFVIIGGGSAGCVLANRLSENPANQVVLLEAGGTADGFWNRLPAAGMKLLGNPESDWCFQTEPDPSLNGRQGFWNAGRMLGGGSSVNGMIYIRGDRSDYDDWAASRLHRLGLGRCPAAFPQVRGLCRRARPDPFDPRPARRQPDRASAIRWPTPSSKAAPNTACARSMTIAPAMSMAPSPCWSRKRTASAAAPRAPS